MDVPVLLSTITDWPFSFLKDQSWVGEAMNNEMASRIHQNEMHTAELQNFCR